MTIARNDTSGTSVFGAMTIAEFCRVYGVGRTMAFAQLKSGALRAKKCGTRTLIPHVEAERWLNSLPSTQSTGELDD